MSGKEIDGARINKTDYNLFLQAFEKPTQIYRYLRMRNLILPVFLHRNLTYLKDRMSRNHSRRKHFKVDSIYLNLIHNNVPADVKSENSTNHNYLTLQFIGFFDKNLFDTKPIRVDIYVTGNDDSAKELIQSVLVDVNPVKLEKSVATVSVPIEKLRRTIGNHMSALLLTVTLTDAKDGGEYYSSEPTLGQWKRVLETELIVFNKYNQCILLDGEYELKMRERTEKCSNQPSHYNWVDVPDYVVNNDDFFQQQPSLKFYLAWTDEEWSSSDESLKCIHNDYNADIESQDQTNGFLNDEDTTMEPVHQNSAVNGKIDNTKSTLLTSSDNMSSCVIFRFIYNNDLSQQTETKEGFFCPWCHLNCFRLYSLLKHLRLCHARFTFRYTASPNGIIVDVTINESFNGSHNTAPMLMSSMPRKWPLRCLAQTSIIVCRPPRKPFSLMEFEDSCDDYEDDLMLARDFNNSHNRLYYHSTTCLPLYRNEFDVNSEDETDPEWLRTKTNFMISEFIDVNESEKEIMKMWNHHVMKNNYVGISQLPLACHMFLDEYGHEVLSKNLYRNFVLHACSLFDFGLISNETVYSLILKLQQRMRRV